MTLRDFSFGLIPLFWNGSSWECLVIHHQKGHWAFPKGHADAGETQHMTAQRELQEETGLVAAQVWWEHPLKEHYTFTDPQGTEVVKEVVFWPARVLQREVQVQEEEVQAAEWMPLEQAQEKMTFPAGKKVVQELQLILPRLQAE